MKFQSFVSFLLASVASLVIAGCGGGGAQVDPNKGGELTISPSTSNPGTFYAGVASTITVSGGRMPYSLTSTDPATLPVPAILNQHSFQVVPNNPGVVDPGLTDTDVPRRTVQIIVRDVQGLTIIGEVKVIRNFLTGYVMSFGASTCPAATSPCGGGDTVVFLSAITNGVLHGNETFKFESVRGGCSFVDFDGIAKPFVIVQSSHEGIAQALLRCPANTQAGIGLIRITHVASGVTADHAFVISATGASQGGLTADPTGFDFIGANKAQCGTGSGDFQVFGGKAPFTARSSDPNISVTPTSNSTPGRFTVNAFNPNVCVNAVVTVQDATGAHVDVTVKTELGTADPPAPAAFTVSPAAMTLACATSGSATAVGGSGSYFATTSHPRVLATVSGSTITVTRCGTLSNPACVPLGDGAVVYPVTATVSVSDGKTIKDITVTLTAATCP